MTDPLGAPAGIAPAVSSSASDRSDLSARTLSSAGLTTNAPNASAGNRKRTKQIVTAVVVLSAITLTIWLLSGSDDAAKPVVSNIAEYDEGSFPDLPVVRSMAEPPAALSLEASLNAIRRATLSMDDGEPQLTTDQGRAERWEIRFPAGGTAETYARQLDDFEIELGILGGSPQIGYLSKLSRAEPARRVGPAAEEKRLYMTWRDGALREVDRALLKRIGVNLQGKILAHFYPAAVEATLAKLEQQFCEPRSLPEIRRTVFTLKPAANGYVFLVGEQQYFDGDLKRPSAGDRPQNAVAKTPAAKNPSVKSTVANDPITKNADAKETVAKEAIATDAAATDPFGNDTPSKKEIAPEAPPRPAVSAEPPAAAAGSR